MTLDTTPRPASLNVRVPDEGGVLRASFGVNPDRWLGLKSGPFRFAIVVLTRRTGNDRGERRLVFEEFVDPARDVAHRRWTPIELNLDEFAGQEILLALSVSTPNLVDPPSDLAGWAEPRIVPRAPAP